MRNAQRSFSDWEKFSTNCNMHLVESLFQTSSGGYMPSILLSAG
ncbi:MULTISPECIES: DUF6783 domain-containing protein [Blautia]